MIFLQQLVQSTFLMRKIDEGGPLFMTSLLVLLVLCLFLITRGFIQVRKEKQQSEKNIKLLNALGLFALVFGVLGQLLGLVNILDTFSDSVEISASQLAMGLKFTILPTLLGAFIFLVSKGATVLLTWFQKEQ